VYPVVTGVAETPFVVDAAAVTEEDVELVELVVDEELDEVDAWLLDEVDEDTVETADELLGDWLVVDDEVDELDDWLLLGLELVEIELVLGTWLVLLLIVLVELTVVEYMDKVEDDTLVLEVTVGKTELELLDSPALPQRPKEASQLAPQ